MNKRKPLLIALASLLALVAGAQSVAITQQVRLTGPDDGPAYFPTLSADGTRLLYGGGDSQQLRLLDLNSGQTTLVSDDAGAAYDAFFGGDGMVYYVTAERGQNNLLYRTGHRFDPATGSHAVVLEPQHGAVALERATRGAALRAKSSSFASGSRLGTAVRTEGSQVIVTVGGRERSFTPVESWAGYCWATLSPDATRVAFFAAGKGIVVIDLDGNILAQLGNYEMPTWLNNRYLVAQHATDDGHQFTSSQLMLLKADGSFRHELTAPTSMTMQPSAAAGRVAYTTIDGQLHLMDIAITE